MAPLYSSNISNKKGWHKSVPPLRSSSLKPQSSQELDHSPGVRSTGLSEVRVGDIRPETFIEDRL
jgi:hypothetical protein